MDACWTVSARCIPGYPCADVKNRFTDVRQLLSCRETLFNVLSANTAVVDALHMRVANIRNMEVEALVISSSVSRRHGAIHESLASVTYLSDIVPKCKSVGLDIEATAQYEVANVLWDQGEMTTSIHMHQNLIDHTGFDSQNVELSLPVLLARMVRLLLVEIAGICLQS